jgi:hypothetical protein
MSEPKIIRVEAKYDDYLVEIKPNGRNFLAIVRGLREYNLYDDKVTGKTEADAESAAKDVIRKRDYAFGNRHGHKKDSYS